MSAPIVIITGPTASGKTAKSISIAKELDGVIINADSKQVYKEIPILTAQPTEAEKDGIDHRLFGFLSITERYSVADWLIDVVREIDDVRASGKTPILVGGTGMYIKSLVDGLSPVPATDEEIRRKIVARYEELGPEEFYEELKGLDPEMAETLNVLDSQRVMRAYEVFKQTGKSILEFQKMPRKIFYNRDEFKIYLIDPPREVVYDKCNKRFLEMVELGVLEEVKNILPVINTTRPSFKAHGLPEIKDYLEEKITLEEAIRLAQRNTRHYIKRQKTWFRGQLDGEVLSF